MFVPGLIQNAAAVGAAFSASLVECVEALTIVLAVSSVSGWRSGLLGASGGAVFLAATVALAGGALIRVPLNDLHVLVGLVLLAFGLSWLRKAVLRTAGMKAQRDEAAIYSRHIDQMRSNLHAGFGRGLDFLAMTAAFKAVVIEGIEVVFIVVTVGRMAGGPCSCRTGSDGGCDRNRRAGLRRSSSTHPSSGKRAQIWCGRRHCFLWHLLARRRIGPGVARRRSVRRSGYRGCPCALAFIRGEFPLATSKD